MRKWEKLVAGTLMTLAATGALVACGDKTQADVTAPVITLADKSVEQGTTIVLKDLVTDVSDNETAKAEIALGYEVKFGTQNVSYSGGKFVALYVGEYGVTVTATDKAGNKATETAKVTVTPDVTAPVITLANAAVTLGKNETSYNITLNITGVTDNVDGSGQELMENNYAYYAETGITAAPSLTAANKLASSVFTPSVEGDYTLTVTYTDKAGNVGKASFTLAVPDRTAPVITLAPKSVEKGSFVNLSELVTDVSDNETAKEEIALGYEVKFGTEIVSVADGKFRAAKDGEYTVTVTATDKAGNKATETTTVTVTPDVTAPVITLGSASVSLGAGQSSYDISLNVSSVTDNADDTVLPDGYAYYAEAGVTATPSLTPGNKLASGTFTAAKGGDYTITVTYADLAGNVGKASFTLTVQDIAAPVIESVNLGESLKVTGKEWQYEITVGARYRMRFKNYLTVNAADPEGSAVTTEYLITDKNGEGVNVLNSNNVAGLTYFIAEADNYYTVAITAKDEAGNVSDPVKIRVNVDKVNAASFDLADVNSVEDGETWRNTSASGKNGSDFYTGSISDDTRNGFGKSYKATKLGADEKDPTKTGTPIFGFFNTSINGDEYKYYNKMSIWVKITADGDLTADDLKALTPKPKNGTEGMDWNCLSGYPTRKGEWTEVVYTFAAMQTHAHWVGGQLTFNNPTSDDTVAVYFDDAIYERFAAVCEGNIECSSSETYSVDDLGIVLPKTAIATYVLKDRTGAVVSDWNKDSFTLATGAYTLEVTVSDSGYSFTSAFRILCDAETFTAPVIEMSLDDSTKVQGQSYDYEITRPINERVILRGNKAGSWLSSFVRSVSDDFDEFALSDLTIAAVNKAGTNAFNTKTIGNNVYNFVLTKAADEYYLVTFSVTDLDGLEGKVVVKINVSDEYSAFSSSLREVNADANLGSYIHDSGNADHVDGHKYAADWTNSYLGYASSLKLTEIATKANTIFGSNGNDISANYYNNKKFGYIRTYVYIEAPDGVELTAEQLQELTPKPMKTGWTCDSYPTEANKWTEVTFAFAEGYTHSTWIQMAFANNTGNADVAVYLGNINFGPIVG